MVNVSSGRKETQHTLWLFFAAFLYTPNTRGTVVPGSKYFTRFHS